MPTIINSLVLTLGLDPKDFVAGAKTVNETAEQTKKRLASEAKAIEESGKQAARFFGQLKTEAIGLFSVLLGGVGLAEFAKGSITANASLARLSVNLGMTTQQLSAWQGAAKMVGGTAQDANASLGALVTTFENIRLGDNNSPAIPVLNLLGINMDELGDTQRTLFDIADKFHNLPAPEANNLGQRLGLTPDFIYLLEQGAPKVREYLEAMRKAGLVTPQMAKAALDAQVQITALTTSFNYLGNELELDVLPTLNGFLQWVTTAAQSSDTKQIVADLGAMASAAGTLSADLENLTHIKFADMFASLPKFLDAMLQTLTHLLAAADDLAHGKLGAAGKELGAAGNAYSGFIAASPLAKALGGAGQAAGSAAASAAGAVSGLPLGVLSGLFAESGLNPNAVNPVSGAYGIGQWLGARLHALKLFASSRGKPDNDLATQLAFVRYEMAGGTKDAGAMALGRLIGSGASDAAILTAMIGRYERPHKGYEYARDIAAGTRYLGSHRSSTTTTSVGHVHIYTQATDADGIAKSIGEALQNNSLVTQADTGMF